MKQLSYLLFVVILMNSCSTVALTGRKQLNLVSSEEVMSLSKQSFTDYMKTAKASTNATNTAMVVRVGKNIANAVETYLKANGRADDVKQFAWEFHLVQDATPNAFCMPGGKIVVNEGILPYTKDENGLAVVLGHEVAHAVANHSSERISQQLLINYGGVALGALLQNKSELTQNIASQVYGLGSQVGVVLPYSRLNENEADHMGLVFTAMAGYDPRSAIPFWQRMQQAGASTPEFLSTHPSDATRIKKLNELMPQALQYYKK
ncbi:M48 family metallopeptidase [Bacteroides sp. OttesenSCG-928-D19]|nr:M48 family metallopeptidase [Bacteroides sp. OttesenSCG-928-D19]